MPAGRPKGSDAYTPEMADRICEHIARGGALYLACEEFSDWPCEATVYNWLNAHPDFMEKYVRARARQADRNVDEIVTIADTEEDPNKARVRIEARKWRAGKMSGKYSDKSAVSLDATVEHKGEAVDPVDIARRIAFAFAKAKAESE